MASEDYKRYQANQRNAAKAFQRITELERGAPLNNGGVGAGGITVRGGSIRILEGGNLEVDGATAVGGELDVTGDATFSGKMKIAGTLELPAGIIGNDALASPADFNRTGGAAVGGFSIPTTGTLVGVKEIPVPPGYSQAIVMCVAHGAGKNGGAGIDYLYVGAQIGSVTPNSSFAQADAGRYANASASATRLLTDLNGGTIEVAIRMRTQEATWTNGAANLDAIAIFLR